MIAAFAALIVLAGVAGCCWYFGAVCQGLDIERAALATERQRLEQWGRNLTRCETATPLYDQGLDRAAVIEVITNTYRCHAEVARIDEAAE